MYQRFNMKKILFILLLLPFVSKAQLEQNHPEPGGHLFVGVRSTSWLRPPSDTATNKTGIARIGTALYIGNGTYWSASGLIYTGTTPISVSGTVISMAQASAIASGYLSSTDWSLFNAKQDALVSGTNIKTVNSSSILGSGNLSVGTVTGTGTANRGAYWDGTSSITSSANYLFDGTTMTLAANGAASTSTLLLTGNPSTAGTTTTDYPLQYFNGGTAPTTWSTNGTYTGWNAVSGFTGNFMDARVNGGASVFKVDYTGATTILGLTAVSNLKVSTVNSGINIQEYAGASSYYGIYSSGVTPSSSNNTLIWNAANTDTYLNTAIGGNLNLCAAQTPKITINSTSATFIANQLFSADNTYDIGASGATRPRTLYFGTSIVGGTGSTINATKFNATATSSADVTYLATGNVTSGALFRGVNSGTVFEVSATGALLASTSVKSPLLIGGTGTTSSLTYKTTTGVGTTGADHIFQVGNNGATEAMRILNSGNVGIGTTSPSAKLHTISTTEQLRIGYDASNYYSTTVGSTGIATFNAVGAGSSFEFSDRVAVPKLKGNSSTPSIAGGAGAGTSPTVALSTNSTDLAGEVVITTDTSPAAGGAMFTVTFSVAYSTAPFVTFSDSNDAGGDSSPRFYITSTTNGFTMYSKSAGSDPIASQQYKFMYHVIQ